MFLPKETNDFGQKIKAGDQERPEQDLASKVTTHVLDLLPPSFRCFQNIQRMRQKKRPGCRENGASPGSLKKPFAHLIFELEDLLAKRWLGDSAFARPLG